ncbi:anti-sigma factor [Streptomyces physcomitrii]|uniref:Regulator of SigK n=1 Tax=Streptomyces physcomitrii TaxID=2724184 RepID=A0ABX1H3X4_9ACTN|nr:anti-sigma factor [Streptomyces physcomitrii]NKI41731.1 anti-sigma factor [Streptomyces physcomitrii]
MTVADLHTLTGAYALHALPEDEREAFEHHLSDCEACAQEVKELAATAGRLGLAVTVTPPPAMKEAVLRTVAQVRQEVPGHGHPVHHASVPGRARRLSRLVLAACLAAAAGLGGVAVWQYDRADQAREEARQAQDRADAVAEVLGAPDARTTSARIGDGASGTVVVSRSRDKAVFVGAGLARPAEGKVYQLWFDDHGAMRPAGLIDSDRTADTVLMAGRIGDASGMGITVEPAGGSKQPTSDPVALMELPA